jgi:pimeloyl-ACP methyl ester carboxylesterase
VSSGAEAPPPPPESLIDAFADFVGSVPYREVALPWGQAQVWDVGTGRPLVLLHGIAGGRRPFFRLVPLLAKSRRVVVPPLRGEDVPAPRATWQDLLGDVARLLETLDLRDATLFGTSFGGALALAHGARGDPRIREIVVQGTFHRFRLRPRDRVAHLLSYALPSAVGAAYLAWRVRRGPETRLLKARAPGIDCLFPQWCATTPFATLRRRAAILQSLDLAEAVRSIRAPLAFLHGEDDRVVPRACFEALRRLRPDVSATVLAGAGHNIALEDPGAMAAWLTPAP